MAKTIVVGRIRNTSGHEHRHLLLARDLEQFALGFVPGVLRLGAQHLGERRAALERP